jgi:AcrR family transcriptional regulator
MASKREQMKPAGAAGRRGKKTSSRNNYENVLDVATGLFAKLGYERTSVRAIADELGIESGSLYSHISTKDEILRNIVERTATEFFDRAAQAMAHEGTAEERLRALCRGHMAVVHGRADAVEVYYANWRRLGGDDHRDVVSLRERYEAMFGQVVEDGIARGEFRALDLHWVVLVLLSSLNWAQQWYSPRGPLKPDGVADELLDVILAGLRASP